MSDLNLSRRRLLAATATTGTMAALAGCGGGEEPEDGGAEEEEEETPAEDGEEEEETPTDGDEEEDGGGGNESQDGDGNETQEGGDGGDAEGRLTGYLEAEPAARGFEGDVQDATGEGEVTVQVGAGENGLAFDPAGVRISSGTTITWEWTGEGGAHNVASTTESDQDLEGGDSDFDFRSGEPQESGTYEETFEETGVGLYMCEPHATTGMKGGFVVEE